MSTNTAQSEVVPVVASVAVQHKAPAADDGWAGIAFKTKTVDIGTTLKANLQTIAVNEAYNLQVKGEWEIANTGITGAVKGDLVYITDADNSLSLSAGAGKRVLGKVTAVAGERALPAGRLRIDLTQKVA